MLSQLSSTSLILLSLSTISQAWPLFLNEKRNPSPAPSPQSYSVVPVDGGPSANNGQAATRTVTNVLTQTQIQTIIATVTAGGSERPTTIVNTQIVPTTVIQTITATTVAETRTMIMEPSVTSVPYDNGQWHTTYYYRSTLSSELIPVSSIVAAVSSSSEVAAGFWNPTPVAGTTTVTGWDELPSSTSPTYSAPTITDWSTYDGKWRDTPENGSWWKKGDRNDATPASS